MRTLHLKLGVLLLFIGVFYYSCKPKGSKELIIGTWQINDKRVLMQTDSDKVEITFNKEGVITSKTYVAGTSMKDDEIAYTITDDGKYIDTKQKDGHKLRLKIVELTDKTLKLKAENDVDTIPILFIRK